MTQITQKEVFDVIKKEYPEVRYLNLGETIKPGDMVFNYFKYMFEPCLPKHQVWPDAEGSRIGDTKNASCYIIRLK